MEKVLGDKKAIALFIVPPLLLFIGVVFIPIIWSIVYSLYSGMPGVKFDFVGLSNYTKMMQDKTFWQAFWMNMRYVGIVTSGQILFGLLMAMIFQFAIKKYKVFVRTIVFFPVVLPSVAVAQLFSKMFEITPSYGLINALLEVMGLTELIQPWLGQGGTAFGVLCIMDIWTAIGFYAVIIYGALVDIPGEVIEAAQIDGANSFQLFRRILIPLLKPILTTCFIFSLSGTLKMFESATALTKGGPGVATRSLSMFMYNTSFTYSEYGYGSTVAVFILIECLVATCLVGLISKKLKGDV
ncbi:ABC transporter permease [Sporanaerobium hydrogeniformans]|uniref:ABC transporter permease n=1 Tax=Sporanaerobium hydrogeniformans TaxID=3072179 RepID=A0AC61DC17_9FIRM|nr:sugar ABC transporter permease [Sporanaerobium hydrogeniformans]PHV70445.1 ABC transporter permease [Sporanaerobium hydrogeniformans]